MSGARPPYQDALAAADVLRYLAAYCPTAVGTPLLGLDVATSDIDLVCYAPDTTAFWHTAVQHFADQSDFTGWQWLHAPRAIVVGFFILDWEIEIFASPQPIEQQYGWLHYRAERRLLEAFGEPLRRRVMELRRAGMKTEPAFAKALGLAGDPYDARAALAHAPINERLLHALAD